MEGGSMNSVCMATYNGEKYVGEQIRSILAQINEEDELVISDDGSTDNTLKCIGEIKDNRIRVLHNSTRYFRDNYENALRAAKGDIIFLSDQDDVWMEGKYRRCVKELETADLVCTNSQLADEQLNVYCPDFFSVYHSEKGILKNAMNNTYYGACMAFRRTLLDQALPFPPTREIGHDIWLGLVAEITGTVRFIGTPYLLYRRHRQNVTSVENLWHRSKRPLWKKIMNRFVVLYYIGNFYIRYGKRK